eukprot:CAMPEP_0194734188 /NCGR_PEP_ID=MMETSP0296-20130528/68594_1 /TAXON_ID=39354 /ORGANISM="Heterosigma akashiwo, Strain CCMP2393" /LENGTH=35 /DNA_ID= /DNA_START= /DNA_END= /DNA_ORIENTATION=
MTPGIIEDDDHDGVWAAALRPLHPGPPLHRGDWSC